MDSNEFVLHYPDGSVARERNIKSKPGKPDAFLLECSNDTRFWVSFEVLPASQYKVAEQKASFFKINGKSCHLLNVISLYTFALKFNQINGLRRRLGLHQMQPGKYWAKAIPSFPQNLGRCISNSAQKPIYANNQFVSMMGIIAVEATDEKPCENAKTPVATKEDDKKPKIKPKKSSLEKTIRMDD